MTRHAYRATSVHGYPRGPWRASHAEALRDCPASGRVVQVDGSALLDERAIPWGVVDVVFSSGEALHPDGIDVVGRFPIPAITARNRAMPLNRDYFTLTPLHIMKA